MSHPKSDRCGNDGFSNATRSQERDRFNGRRALERMGLMAFDRPRRNPYWDLNILSLMRGPQREDRSLLLSSSAASQETDWREESPNASQDPEPLLL